MGLYQTKFWFRNTFAQFTKYFIRVNPDLLSYLAVFVSAVTGLALFCFPYNTGLLGVAFVLVVLRMVLNTFDGMIAIAQGKKTMIGEVVNALPDRYSDIFLMLGLALCPANNHVIGAVAIVSVLLVSYTGMLGKAMGVSWQHQGPAGKVDRLVVLLIVIAGQYILVSKGVVLPKVAWVGTTLFDWLMLWFVVGSQVTILNRLRGLIGEIRQKENAGGNASAVQVHNGIVVYDSWTGCTKEVAEAVASSAGFDICHVDGAARNLKKYKFVVLGTLNIRAMPSPKMSDFLEKAELPARVALFVTFGMPVWGQVSTAILLNAASKKLRAKGCVIAGTFQCPGFHAKFKTYKGRPDSRDLERAMVFGKTLGGSK